MLVQCRSGRDGEHGRRAGRDCAAGHAANAGTNTSASFMSTSPVLSAPQAIERRVSPVLEKDGLSGWSRFARALSSTY